MNIKNRKKIERLNKFRFKGNQYQKIYQNNVI